jgi:hypothetical protein
VPFSGGSPGPSAPVTLTAPAANQVPLTLFGAAGQTSRLLSVQDTVAGGIALFEVRAEGGVEITSNDIARPAIFAAGAIGSTVDIVQVAAGGTTALAVSKTGYLIVKLNAAPADAELAAGDMALWFDKTNGASKLMVKAKQADGTVKTGALALA